MEIEISDEVNTQLKKLNKFIEEEDDAQIYKFSEKILKSLPLDEDIFQCFVISMI